MARRPRLTPRKLPTQDRSRFTVDAIIEATARLLKTTSYEELTTNHAADRAGVSIGSLYQYFPNKPSLVSAVCVSQRTHGMEVLGARLVEATTAEPELAPALVADGLLAPWDEDPDLSRILLELPSSLQIWRKCEAAEAELLGLLTEYLAECTQRPDPDLAAWVLFRSVDGLGQRAVLERAGALADGQIAEEAARLVQGLLGA